MKINGEKCIGCGNCIIICPVQAISFNKENKAEINRELCVECYVCHRDADCPVKAIRSERLKWPRVIRNPFSSVVATHKLTGVPGRGTEEMKTNDVTNRFKVDEIGISIEIGRPGLGTRLANVELFTVPLCKFGVEFEEQSPVTAIIDNENGLIKKELKDERVLSAIIEFKIPHEMLGKIIELIRKVEKNIDTVFTVGIISRILNNDVNSILELLSQHNLEAAPNAKINLGLGRKTF